MIWDCLPVFFLCGLLSGNARAAGAMANSGLPIHSGNLQRRLLLRWKALGASPFSETEFQYVHAGWLQDSDNALKQSIAWAVQVQDADFLKQILAMIALERDPETGQVRFRATSEEGTVSTQLEYARLSLGVLTIGDYEFQMDENRLIGWRKTSSWTPYESFPLPVEIPPTILERFRTQA